MWLQHMSPDLCEVISGFRKLYLKIFWHTSLLPVLFNFFFQNSDSRVHKYLEIAVLEGIFQWKQGLNAPPSPQTQSWVRDSCYKATLDPGGRGEKKFGFKFGFSRTFLHTIVCIWQGGGLVFFCTFEMCSLWLFFNFKTWLIAWLCFGHECWPCPISHQGSGH